MKKIFTIILVVGLLMGCSLNTNVPINIATDIAFTAALQNNPTYKVPVLTALNSVKTYLNSNITYDDLILYINKQFAGKYIYIGIILADYIATDKPIFETYLPMFEEYKIEIIKKIDRLIILASI